MCGGRANRIINLQRPSATGMLTVRTMIMDCHVVRNLNRLPQPTSAPKETALLI